MRAACLGLAYTWILAFLSMASCSCGELSLGKLGKPALSVVCFIRCIFLKCMGCCFSRDPGGLEEQQILSFTSGQVEIKTGVCSQQI